MGSSLQADHRSESLPASVKALSPGLLSALPRPCSTRSHSTVPPNKPEPPEQTALPCGSPKPCQHLGTQTPLTLPRLSVPSVSCRDPDCDSRQHIFPLKTQGPLDKSKRDWRAQDPGHGCVPLLPCPAPWAWALGTMRPPRTSSALAPPSPHSYTSHVDPPGALVPPTPSLSADTPTPSFVRKRGHCLGMLLDAMPFLTRLSSSLEDGIFFSSLKKIYFY